MYTLFYVRSQCYGKRLLASSCLSVCPSVLIELFCSQWTGFHAILYFSIFHKSIEKLQVSLTLILLTCRIWWAPNNASRWQIEFNSAFIGLISVFTTARHLSQYWARLIQSTSFYRMYLRCILILSLFLCLDLPRGIFSFTLPRQPSLGNVLLPPICHMPPQSYHPWSDHANNIWWPVQFIYEFSPSTGYTINIRH
jgi:hypothetical protein